MILKVGVFRTLLELTLTDLSGIISFLEDIVVSVKTNGDLQ